MPGIGKDQLTKAEIAALRLVPLRTSKDIARELGVSHHTVDQHIKSAMAKLGASDRRQAAQIVERSHPQYLGTQPLGIASAPQSPSLQLQEERAVFDFAFPQSQVAEVPHDLAIPLDRPNPWWRPDPDGLGVGKRLALVLAIALACPLAISIIINFTSSMINLLKLIAPSRF